MTPDEEVLYLRYCHAAAGDVHEYTRRMGSACQRDFIAALRAAERPATVLHSDGDGPTR